MDGRNRTETEYLTAISEIVRFIQSGLDETITPRQLAAYAGFSPHHFHRIFRSIIGESVMDFIRRLRLERAAYRLKTTTDSIGWIAIDGSYGSPEAFARVFQSYFGMWPSDFRKTPTSHELPTVSGVHYQPGGLTPLRPRIDTETLTDEGLCSAHRRWPDEAEEFSGKIQSMLRNFAGLLFADPPLEELDGIDAEIATLQLELRDAERRLQEAQSEIVEDHPFLALDGSQILLSNLFGEYRELVLVHSMGVECAICTMWADGWSGIAPHFGGRNAFAVCSPDSPETQQKTANRRGWNFRLVSAFGSTNFHDLGFWDESKPNPGPWPGISRFSKDRNGTLRRTSKTSFDATTGD